MNSNRVLRNDELEHFREGELFITNKRLVIGDNSFHFRDITSAKIYTMYFSKRIVVLGLFGLGLFVLSFFMSWYYASLIGILLFCLSVVLDTLYYQPRDFIDIKIGKKLQEIQLKERLEYLEKANEIIKQLKKNYS